MKTILTALLLQLCLVTIAGNLQPASVNRHTTELLASDADFVSAVVTLYSLQQKIGETGSAFLVQRSSEGTITESEKQELAMRLGFSDYAGFIGKTEEVSAALLRLKEKYPELNRPADAAPVVNNSITTLAAQGKITGGASAGVNYDFTCLRELLANILVCYHTSPTLPALSLCIRAALAQFRACVIAHG